MNYIWGSLKVFMQRGDSTSGKLIWRMYNNGFGKRSGKRGGNKMWEKQILGFHRNVRNK